MANPADMLPGRHLSADEFERALSGHPLREGVVTNEPASLDEPLYVAVELFSRDLVYGPCPWQPRIISDTQYATPSKGDAALVAVSDDERGWVVLWWPQEYGDLT